MSIRYNNLEMEQSLSQAKKLDLKAVSSINGITLINQKTLNGTLPGLLILGPLCQLQCHQWHGSEPPHKTLQLSFNWILK